MPKPIKPPNPLVLGRKVAAGTLDIWLNKLDELIKSGEIKAIKIGRDVKVPMTELQRFVAERPAFKRSRAA